MVMFSRVSFPRQILSDRGTNFTSGLMRDMNRLLSVDQLTTTPYHPICIGLIEKFNGTLKQMLRKMCQEKPRTWDTYLALLLFAYREVPQTSLGFSPFELIYGRHVRGLMSELKDIRTEEGISDDVKTTYGYVLDLRNRLEETIRLAHEKLREAQQCQKRYYDRTARGRGLKVGERALLLLPTEHNKLLLHWKGPHPVVAKKSKVDYLIDLGHAQKLFHVNMLKRYEERLSNPNKVEVSSSVAVEDAHDGNEIPYVAQEHNEVRRS